MVLRAVRHDRLVSVHDQPTAFASLILVWAMIALLHLVACSNVASLMLARSIARRHEFGVRICLGASRARIVFSSFADTVILASVGAAGGIYLTVVLTNLICQLQFLSALNPGFSWRVLSIATVVAIATAVKFGLLPAIDASKRDPSAVLQSASGGRVAGTKNRSMNAILIIQISISLLLLVDAGVLLKYFDRQSQTALGFDVNHTLIADVSLAGRMHTHVEIQTAYDDAIRQLASVPGIDAVSTAATGPLLPGRSASEMSIGDYAYARDEPKIMGYQRVGPGYFQAMGTRLRVGREFEPRDAVATSATRGFDVAIVNEALARKYFGTTDPIGKQLAVRGQTPSMIVGVVENVHDVSLVDRQ